MFCISSKTYAFVNVTYKEIRKTCDKNYRSQFCFVWSEVSILPFKSIGKSEPENPAPTQTFGAKALLSVNLVGVGDDLKGSGLILKGNMDTSQIMKYKIKYTFM